MANESINLGGGGASRWEKVKGKPFDTVGNGLTVLNGVLTAVGGASFEAVVVEELPESGENGKIYLVPNDGEVPDVYDEYIWIASTTRFELIGTTRITFTTKTLTFVRDDGTTETVNVMIQ